MSNSLSENLFFNQEDSGSDYCVAFNKQKYREVRCKE